MQPIGPLCLSLFIINISSLLSKVQLYQLGNVFFPIDTNYNFNLIFSVIAFHRYTAITVMTTATIAIKTSLLKPIWFKTNSQYFITVLWIKNAYPEMFPIWTRKREDKTSLKNPLLLQANRMVIIVDGVKIRVYFIQSYPTDNPPPPDNRMP